MVILFFLANSVYPLKNHIHTWPSIYTFVCSFGIPFVIQLQLKNNVHSPHFSSLGTVHTAPDTETPGPDLLTHTSPQAVSGEVAGPSRRKSTRIPRPG